MAEAQGKQGWFWSFSSPFAKEFKYAGKPPPNGINKLKLILEARETVSLSLSQSSPS